MIIDTKNMKFILILFLYDLFSTVKKEENEQQKKTRAFILIKKLAVNYHDMKLIMKSRNEEYKTSEKSKNNSEYVIKNYASFLY